MRVPVPGENHGKNPENLPRRRDRATHESPEIAFDLSGFAVVAGAGFAECYTAPETYWIDLG